MNITKIKKILCVTAAAVMALSFAACSDEEEIDFSEKKMDFSSKEKSDSSEGKMDSSEEKSDSSEEEIDSSYLSDDYMKPIENYFEGIEKNDGELMMEAYHEYQLNYEKKNYHDGSADELEDSYKSGVKTLYNLLKEEFGSDLTISVSVEDKEKIDKGYLKDYEEYLQEKWDTKSLEVTEGYEVEVKVTVKGDDDKDSDSSDFVVLKVDGDWCMCDISPDDVQDALDDLLDAMDY